MSFMVGRCNYGIANKITKNCATKEAKDEEEAASKWPKHDKNCLYAKIESCIHFHWRALYGRVKHVNWVINKKKKKKEEEKNTFAVYAVENNERSAAPRHKIVTLMQQTGKIIFLINLFRCELFQVQWNLDLYYYVCADWYSLLCTFWIV